MAAVSTIQEINRELATKINKETRMNPQSPYANKFVGIANGQVVLVADGDDFDAFARRLREIEPDPTKAFWVEASYDYSKPVWV